ncbi:MAG TPA: isoaspartyl peptidase/L-asparaginase [Saprospiraceae bacterium]|nr:isoaspartyl peptidase/L-asparaginase [Saprospiraceae bacterium]
MKNNLIYFVILLIIHSSCQPMNKPSQERPEYALVIHGGAGVITRNSMDSITEKSYRDALDFALTTGEKILSAGGTSMDAVEAVVASLEDNPLFNAGKGAVFNYDGKNEMDASIMNGIDLTAGAVGGVRHIRNPVKLARMVMEKSPHVMLVGEGAETFATQNGMELVDSSYFFTQRRWDEHIKELEEEKASAGAKHGTVGAVALDKFGNLAAATSTGGMTNKRWNRIGDSPVIGAGTYANNATCAISSTGHGEFFIRYAVAHDISAMMEYKGVSLEEAAKHVIMDKLLKVKGEGGIIGVDHDGKVTMTFNSEGMYRGYVIPAKRYVGIYGDE